MCVTDSDDDDDDDDLSQSPHHPSPLISGPPQHCSRDDSRSWRLKIDHKSPSLVRNLSLLSLYPLSPSFFSSTLLHLSLAPPLPPPALPRLFFTQIPQTGELEYESSVSSGKKCKKQKYYKKTGGDIAQLGYDELEIWVIVR